MALYLIGDLQGCLEPFIQLLERIEFSPSRDHLILMGDLVNRGPHSLETLDKVISLGNAVTCLLGNHETHLMGAAYGIRQVHPFDTITPILQSPKLWSYIEWIRQQHMALYQNGWLMVHAGVAPQWDLAQTLTCAQEVENALRAPDVKDFIREIFSNQPNRWSDNLTGIDRLRFSTNALLRTRFCYADGTLDFDFKEGMQTAPPDLIPWFKVPGRKTAHIPIAFGHWSTLGFTTQIPNLLALDTGCLWGGNLTAARIANDASNPNDCSPTIITQIACKPSLDPHSLK